MAIEQFNFCPLGKECESIVDGKIHKCMWHIKVVGKDPQTNEDIDQEGCAVAWLPLIAVENSKQQRSTSAAIESFRNEMIEANKVSALLMSQQMKALK